jgi:aminopeptidase
VQDWQKLAEVLVGYSTEVRPGELVLVHAPAVAQPLAEEVVRAVVRARAHPMLRLQPDGDWDDAILLADGDDEQLGWIDPGVWADRERCDVRIVVTADALSRRNLGDADPARQAFQERAHMPLYDLQRNRAAEGSLRWCLVEYPTEAAAQDAGMSFDEYIEFVTHAGFLHLDDPVARWRELRGDVDRVADFLEQVEELRVVAHETDLRLGVGGRKWVRSYGHRNFPDGETYTGPVEDDVEGMIAFTFPGLYRGREADGIRLRFERGEVVEATARSGEDFLRQMIGMDDGARRVGEFAFGLNESVQRFTRNVLYDEKMGGTVHLALGAAYPETGSQNESALHWDIVCDLRDGGEVYADGRLVYRAGRFLPDVG